MDTSIRIRIERLVAELDGIIPRDGAAIRIDAIGGGLDEGCLTANTAGFLSGGIELMKAAFVRGQQSEIEGMEYVKCDFGRLVVPESEVGFDAFARDEHLRAPDQTSSPIVQFIGCAILLALLSCMIIGIVTVIQWIF